ncbi:hypothetical protein L0244_19870 [bacterium]|nr:hypothetical protein [bacterium]
MSGTALAYCHLYGERRKVNVDTHFVRMERLGSRKELPEAVEEIPEPSEGAA